MLRNIDNNIWIAEQPLRYFGLNVGTRMTVIRFQDNQLAVISPIKIDNNIIEQLNKLGQVKHIISPNLFHYLFLSDFKAIYPEAKIYAVSGLQKKKPEIPVDYILENNSHYFLDELEYFLFDGFKTLVPTGATPLNEYVFFHPQSKTLILTDTAFHFDESSALIMRLLSQVTGGYQQLKPSLLEQLATQDKNQIKQSAQRVLQWNFTRAIVAHGSIVEDNAKQKFKKGYESFLGQTL